MQLILFIDFIVTVNGSFVWFVMSLLGLERHDSPSTQPFIGHFFALCHWMDGVDVCSTTGTKRITATFEE